MATVTGFTAARMQEIEDSAIVGGEVVGDNLILTKHDDTTIDAGPVIGPIGPAGPAVMGIPGEIKMWGGDVLPEEISADIYGNWVWANGDHYLIADYPDAYAHISRNWDTAHGRSAPPAGRFRVPDLQGFVPAGLDGMPIDGSRENRVTRSVAIIVAGSTGEEIHEITIAEMPSHGHAGTTDTEPAHTHAPALSQGVGAQMMMSNPGSTATTMSGSVGRQIGLGLATVGPAGAHDHTLSIAAAGSGNEHENMQPTVFVPYIVKLDD